MGRRGDGLELASSGGRVWSQVEASFRSWGNPQPHYRPAVCRGLVWVFCVDGREGRTPSGVFPVKFMPLRETDLNQLSFSAFAT